jgi:Rieske Fe-S protein
MTPLDRRGFVATCATLCGGALLGCVSMVTHPVPVTGGRVRIPLASYPELRRPDGAIKVLPEGHTEPVYVVATAHGFAALSPICTHRGCTVDVSGERLVCPCHGSTYDREGRVLKGPAQRPLPRYSVTRSGDDLIVELS